MNARASIDSSIGAPAAPAAPQLDVAVGLRAVSKVYGRNGAAVRALDAVSIDFVRGSFTAVMGPSGFRQKHAASLRGDCPRASSTS